MINPLSQIPNTGNFENHPRLPINDKIANNMPNGLLRIPNIDNSKNMNNHNVVNHYPKQIFNAHLSPSVGSLTESFVKSKTLFSPIYRNNEAISRYEAISLGPIALKQIKKRLDRII